METRLLFGCLVSLAVGAIAGRLVFDDIITGTGIGISLGAAVCGALIAYGYERDK